MVKAGAFRQDLLYRLNVITIELPPLRERPEDVPHLAAHFLARFAANYNRPARGFAPEALALIGNYTWPGNVRELQNVIERATILSPGDQIEPRHLAIGGSGNVEARQRVGTAISLDELEKLHIQQVLATSETLDQAAKTLGIDASTLYRKRKTYSIG
jgi:two-component system, NtrC family, response regulator AlgB